MNSQLSTLPPPILNTKWPLRNIVTTLQTSKQLFHTCPINNIKCVSTIDNKSIFTLNKSRITAKSSQSKWECNLNWSDHLNCQHWQTFGDLSCQNRCAYLLLQCWNYVTIFDISSHNICQDQAQMWPTTTKLTINVGKSSKMSLLSLNLSTSYF